MTKSKAELYEQELNWVVDHTPDDDPDKAAIWIVRQLAQARMMLKMLIEGQKKCLCERHLGEVSNLHSDSLGCVLCQLHQKEQELSELRYERDRLAARDNGKAPLHLPPAEGAD